MITRKQLIYLEIPEIFQIQSSCKIDDPFFPRRHKDLKSLSYLRIRHKDFKEPIVFKNS